MKRHITAYTLACVLALAATATAQTPTSVYLDGALWVTTATLPTAGKQPATLPVEIAQTADVTDLEVTVTVPLYVYEADADRLTLGSEHSLTVVSVGGVPYLSAQLALERARVAGLRLVDGGMAVTFDTGLEW